ncbi:Endophilin-A [Trichoplax sp. H2]|nr:Endophilin-A [Trichoplax sp. H2]|eukprot:RDD43737.1 Endophilin-A [Trichoplax sp. H2]
MSFAGLKKQINKANQYVSEKVGGAQGTKLDDQFLELEKQTDALAASVENIKSRTIEVLQPNPAARFKLHTQGAYQKITGSAKNVKYPQPEFVLGEVMIKSSTELGEDLILSQTLVDVGECMKQIADAKDALDANIKQNFLEPLTLLQTKDLKEVMHHRKKLSGRRLDYDCKRRKKDRGSNVSDDDLKIAEEKFLESKELAESGMINLFDNESDQIGQLLELIKGLMQYYAQGAELLGSLTHVVQQKMDEAVAKPRTERPIIKPTSLPPSYDEVNPDDDDDDTYAMAANNDYAIYNNHSNKPGGGKPCAKALYDFSPENEGELGFHEGDLIYLINRIDENWMEGTCNGQTGYFPTTYVEVVVALP